VKHVFRLLEGALAAGRGVEWVLLENVEALLDRGRAPPAERGGGAARPRGRSNPDAPPPGIAELAARFEALGYQSWAHRVVNAAGEGEGERGRGERGVASARARATRRA
jgi:hypothetical protein